MKIVLMIDWFIYYTVELANALSREHEVMLITRDHNYEISSPEHPVRLEEFLDQCLDKKIRWEPLRYRRKSLKNLLEVGRLYRKIKAFGPDVVHIQKNPDWRIFWLAKKVGFHKVVITIHDVVSHPGEGRRKPRHWVLMWKILDAKAARIIVHGDYLKKQFIAGAENCRDKVSVVPHGALSIYKMWDDETVKEEKDTVLFFGRISKYKGLDVLIKAQPLVSRKVPEAKIIIAGKGRDRDFTAYQSLIQDQSRFEIHYRFISNQEIPRFFRRAAVVVLPYIEASQSGVIPIAYAFGKPVVATDVGSIPEVVDPGKTGFIVPPNNPQALAEALAEILTHRELREAMGKNALVKAETELSWAAVAKKTAKIYEMILPHE